MCEIVTNAGAEFIKTSTGFSTAGATFSDVELMRQYVGTNVKVKAMEEFLLLRMQKNLLNLAQIGLARVGW